METLHAVEISHINLSLSQFLTEQLYLNEISVESIHTGGSWCKENAPLWKWIEPQIEVGSKLYIFLCREP